MDLRTGIAPQRARGNPAALAHSDPVARNSQSPSWRAIGRNSPLAGGGDERRIAGPQFSDLYRSARSELVRQRRLEQRIGNDAQGIAAAHPAFLPAIKLAPGL